MLLKRRVLAWDAPNMDMCIAQLLGCKPTPAYRPNFVALARWFVNGADQEPGPHHEEAAVFVNVPEHLTERLRQWVMWLTASGYRVFAKPKLDNSDIDREMVDYLTGIPTAELRHVVVGSHDAHNFIGPLETLAAAGVRVTVVGFAEFAGGLSKSPVLDFVDLESIPGLFVKPLPRIDLRTLPPEGRWFEPRGPLGAVTVPPPVPPIEEDDHEHENDEPAVPVPAVAGAESLAG